MLGLYVHIPFCSAICNYCNFNRGLFDAALKEQYVAALRREIAKLDPADIAGYDAFLEYSAAVYQEGYVKLGSVLSEAEREEDIDTLGGLVFSLAGRIPKRGEVVKHPSGLAFEIVDADSRRIKRLKVKNLPKPEAAE